MRDKINFYGKTIQKVENYLNTDGILLKIFEQFSIRKSILIIRMLLKQIICFTYYCVAIQYHSKIIYSIDLCLEPYIWTSVTQLVLILQYWRKNWYKRLGLSK